MPNWKMWWCVFVGSLLLAYWGTTSGPGGLGDLPTAIRRGSTDLQGQGGPLLGLLEGHTFDTRVRANEAYGPGPAAP
jgi:hypothetical protein